MIQQPVVSYTWYRDGEQVLHPLEGFDSNGDLVPDLQPFDVDRQAQALSVAV